MIKDELNMDNTIDPQDVVARLQLMSATGTITEDYPELLNQLHATIDYAIDNKLINALAGMIVDLKGLPERDYGVIYSRTAPWVDIYARFN